MKKILLLSGIVALLTTIGCHHPRGGRGHGHHGHGAGTGQPGIFVPPPVVVVQPPAGIDQ